MHRAIVNTLDQARGPLIASGAIGLFAVALFGVLKLGLPVWSLLIVAIGFTYVLATIRNPVIGLIAVICVFFVPVELPIGVSLLHVIGVLTAALVLLWFLYERRRIVFASIQIPLVLLGILIVTSLWFSLDATRTTFYARRWVFNMMFVVLMLNLVTTFKVFTRVIWAVMIMAAVNSLFGMIDYSRSSDFYYRSTGLMENANGFGHLAALAFPLALYQYLYREGALRIAGLVLSAVLLGGVVASVSRGALVSVIVVVTVTFVRERRRAIPLLLVVGLALAATPFLPQFYQQRVGNLLTDVRNSLDIGQERGLTTRGSLNKAAVKMWSTHPILGVGIGNFGHYYIQRDFVEEVLAVDTRVAHNIYAQALAETGLVGSGILIWLLFITGRSIWRSRSASERGSAEWIYFGAIEMMALAICVSTASSGNLMDNDFWMFIALTAVSARVAVFQKRRREIPATSAAA